MPIPGLGGYKSNKMLELLPLKSFFLQSLKLDLWMLM